MPNTSEASATKMSVTKRLPWAHSTIISEKALPMPVVVTTLMIMPTATSNRAVDTMVFTPPTTASKISVSLIGLVDNQEAAITLMMANAAEEVGVRPAIKNPTSTVRGIIKCQPSFKTSETFSAFSSTTGVIPKRFASMRTK